MRYNHAYIFLSYYYSCVCYYRFLDSVLIYLSVYNLSTRHPGPIFKRSAFFESVAGLNGVSGGGLLFASLCFLNNCEKLQYDLCGPNRNARKFHTSFTRFTQLRSESIFVTYRYKSNFTLYPTVQTSRLQTVTARAGFSLLFILNI